MALLRRGTWGSRYAGWRCRQASMRACHALARLPVPAIWLLTRLPLVALAIAVGAQADSTYLHYGQEMAAGALPYRDFAVEYPPLSITFLALPALAAHAFARLSMDSYTLFFGLQALVLDALLCIVLARGAGRQVVVWYLILTLAGGSLLQTFDLLPSALTVTAVLLQQQGRDRWAWLVLAAAVASKGWPLFLVPLFLVLDLGRPRRLALNACLAALLCAALIAPGMLGGVTRAEQALAFHAQRAPEVETVYANVAMAAHDAFGVPARVFTGLSAAVPQAHSSNVMSALPGWAELPHLMLAVLLILGYLWTLPRLRGNRDALPAAAALLVGLFIMGFSVLETQYLLWLIPLAAVVLARSVARARLGTIASAAPLRGAACLLLFALLSHLLRMQWAALLAMEPGTVAIAIARNICLMLALVFLWRCIPGRVQSRDDEGRRRAA